MLVKTGTIAIVGVDPIKVDVEVSTYNRGLPRFEIVGLPNKSIDESRLRIKSAFINLGLEFPERKVTVNLAPADIKKEGSFYDLPIAVGIYCCVNNIKIPDRTLFFGEISLNGNLRYTNGAFLVGYFASKNNYDHLFVPYSAKKEVALFNGFNTYPARNLTQIFEHLTGSNKLIAAKNNPVVKVNEVRNQGKIYKSIIGQRFSKRALTISVAGRHNLLMVGPPGAGKSILARSSQELVGELSEGESVEVSKIYSSVGKLKENTLISKPPFRYPHHTISYAGMIGGGSIPQPGEISFAHRGILFLDELTEFPKRVLETLRQPMEQGSIQVSRARDTLIFPSRFLLLAACNPCPCGYYGDKKVRCKCSPKIIDKYFQKISGPILDRIDLHVRVNRVDESLLLRYDSKLNSNFDQARESINLALSIQRQRFKKDGIFYNAEMDNEAVANYCILSDDSRNLLLQATRKMALSARSFFRIIKISRTIADLSGIEDIRLEHISEALHYRPNFSD
jgi:magnesium chelatase family protein